jgi:hypothetical protein
MSYSHIDCPFCPFVTTTNKLGQIRTDNLRVHVKTSHPTDSKSILCEYEGVNGFKLEKLEGNLYIQTKLGKYNDGFCNCCASWIQLEGFGQSVRIAKLKTHECKPIQVRQKKAKVIGGKVIPTEKKVNSQELVRAFEKVGYKDQIILSDDIEFDIDKTLKQIKTMSPPPSAESTLERAKKDKRLVALKIQEREDLRRDAIVESQLIDEEDEDDEYPPDVFDDYDDVIGPLLVELVRSVPLKEKLSNQNKDMRIELDKWEDKYDQLTTQKDAEIAALKEALCELSRSTSEERSRLQAENRKWKSQQVLEQTVPDVEATETIQHVVESNYQLWTLPFQG